jgi:hypothetical protein
MDKEPKEDVITRYITIPDLQNLLEAKYRSDHGKKIWIKNWIHLNMPHINNDSNENERKQAYKLAEEKYDESYEITKNYEEEYEQLVSTEKEACAIISSSLKGDLSHKFLLTSDDHEISTYELWNSIKEDYIITDITQISNYETEWSNLVISSDELVKDFSQRVKLLASYFRACKIPKSEIAKVNKFLTGCRLGGRTDLATAVLAVTANVNNDSTLESVTLKLHSLVNDGNLDNVSSRSKSKSLNIKSSEPKKINALKKKIKKQHLKELKKSGLIVTIPNDKYKSKISNKPKDKSHIRCYNCNEIGHYKSNVQN